MNRNLYNSRGAATLVGNQTPRWRTVLIALVLVLTIGSAGQTPQAQAAPAAADKFPIDFELTVFPEKLPQVRTCGQLKLYAGVFKTIYKGLIGLDGKEIPIPGRAPNPQITGVKVSGPGELKKQLQDYDDPGGSSSWIFTSTKTGKVKLKFTVFIKNEWIGAKEEVIKGTSGVEREFPVSFTVLPCKVKVKTIIHFPVEIYDITVISDNAVMTADEAGTFTGSTSMYWVYSNFNLAPCTIEIGATDSQVDMTGQLDEEGGQFTATQTFQPQTAGGIVTCPGVGSGGGSGGFTVAPLTFSVASTGGVSTQTATAEGVSGSATIVVTPEEEGAAAFNTDSRAALSPSAWWAMLWDDFPWSYSALLALR